MKYLFINSLAGTGSTGRIAAEQCRELMAQGHECLIAYGRGKGGCDDIPTLKIGSESDQKIHGALNRVLDCHGFGSRAATERFLEQVRRYDPDVIWLHNIHGYYLHIGVLFDYLRTCGKKIYWTLHDCWSFTGHCAYFDFVGCDRWKTGCHDCPQKGTYPASLVLDGSERNYEKKKALFTGIPNLTLITVSQWLADRVKQSFLKDYPVEIVYNTVDKSIFHPVKSEFRGKYGLENQFLILGVANVWDRRKGLEEFFALSQKLDARFRIVLIGLTQKQIRKLPREILGLPRTPTVRELVEAYAAADVYVTPSVEETFGMTVLEAKSCGTEVIVYQGTACEEVVRQVGGIAVPRGLDYIYRAIIALKEQKVC